jgi:hypothetical protein
MKKFKELSNINEGRPSQRHPLEGHEYHKKSNAELEYIAKDAHKAAEAMKGHNTTAENKYRDQANDSATVRYFRKKSGTPDWYKKKYGHMKEETDTSEKTEMAQTQLHFMKYAAEEILEYIEMGGEVEEWYQNKLSKVMSDIESLHSYVEGESRRTGMKEEVAKPKNKPADVTHPEPAANELYVMRQIEKEKAAKKKKGMKEGYEDHHLFPAYMQKILKKVEASPEEKARNAARAAANKAKPATPQKQEPYKPLGGRDEKSGRSYSEEVELQESRRANIVREAMEAAKKKKKQQEQQSNDTFNADPTLSSEIVKS